MTSTQKIVPEMQHHIVYRHDQQFCSWPYNAGLWKISDNELVVGFMNINCDYSYARQLNHNRVETYGNLSIVRTVDGGATWSERTVIADHVQLQDKLNYGQPEVDKTPADFTNPLTLLACWSTPNSGDAQAKPWTTRSVDGGRSWGPVQLLDSCGIPRFQGRPSYMVRPDGVILLFLTAKPTHDPYDRPVVYSSLDSGANWALHSYMPNSSLYRMICPSPLLLPDGKIVVAVRCKPSMASAFNEIYVSEDGGWTWQLNGRLNDQGDTCDLCLLDDGRIVAVYGYRRPPFGIRAKISEDGGKTWGAEIMVRDDGGSRDLGYARCVSLKGNRVFTAYYFNSKDDHIQQNGGVRHIAGTIISL